MGEGFCGTCRAFAGELRLKAVRQASERPSESLVVVPKAEYVGGY